MLHTGLTARTPVCEPLAPGRHSLVIAAGAAMVLTRFLRSLQMRDKVFSGLHNPVTLHVVCHRCCFVAAVWRPGALLERTCLARRLAGVGAECRLPAAELLSAVSLVVAGRDQGGVSRSR